MVVHERAVYQVRMTPEKSSFSDVSSCGMLSGMAATFLLPISREVVLALPHRVSDCDRALEDAAEEAEQQ